MTNQHDSPDTTNATEATEHGGQYEKPRVIDHGSLRDLTQSGLSVGSDMLGGSGGSGGS